MEKSFIERQLDMVTSELEGKNMVQVLKEIAVRSKDSLVLSEKDQTLIGAILGSMLHQAYCDGRKLDAPKDGLVNNPRIKELDKPLDQNFVSRVLSGEIKTSKTLFIEDGKVMQDIANTSFVNLSPYWKKDNFMAGCAAARTVISTLQFEDLLKNPQFKQCAEVLIANAIHESWIARENVYYDVAPDGNVYTNQELNVSFVNLSEEEQNKDIKHYDMAKKLIDKLFQMMSEYNKNNQSNKGEGEGPANY